MPSYRTHTAFNLFLVLPISLTALYCSMHPKNAQLVSFMAMFIYTTLFMSPDMDLSYKIKWYSLRGLLSLPFRSYARVFKHRGISHSLLLGSLTRVVWLSLVIILLLLCLSFLLSHPFFVTSYVATSCLVTSYIHYKKEIFYGLSGICLADAAHILLDKCLKH